MAKIRFACPHCSSIMQVDEQFARNRGRCAKCSQIIEVPDPETVVDLDISAESVPHTASQYFSNVVSDGTVRPLQPPPLPVRVRKPFIGKRAAILLVSFIVTAGVVAAGSYYYWINTENYKLEKTRMLLDELEQAHFKPSSGRKHKLWGSRTREEYVSSFAKCAPENLKLLLPYAQKIKGNNQTQIIVDDAIREMGPSAIEPILVSFGKDLPRLQSYAFLMERNDIDLNTILIDLLENGSNDIARKHAAILLYARIVCIQPLDRTFPLKWPFLDRHTQTIRLDINLDPWVNDTNRDVAFWSRLANIQQNGLTSQNRLWVLEIMDYQSPYTDNIEAANQFMASILSVNKASFTFQEVDYLLKRVEEHGDARAATLLSQMGKAGMPYSSRLLSCIMSKKTYSRQPSPVFTAYCALWGENAQRKLPRSVDRGLPREKRALELGWNSINSRGIPLDHLSHDQIQSMLTGSGVPPDVKTWVYNLALRYLIQNQDETIALRYMPIILKDVLRNYSIDIGLRERIYLYYQYFKQYSSNVLFLQKEAIGTGSLDIQTIKKMGEFTYFLAVTTEEKSCSNIMKGFSATSSISEGDLKNLTEKSWFMIPLLLKRTTGRNYKTIAETLYRIDPEGIIVIPALKKLVLTRSTRNANSHFKTMLQHYQVVGVELSSTIPSTQPEKDVFIHAVDENGKAVNCAIVIIASGGSNGKRYMIPQQGKVIPRPEQEMILYAFAERSSRKGDYFVAKQKVSPSDKITKIVVHRENGVDVTFKILDKTGKPLSGGNVEFYRMVDGYRFDVHPIRFRINKKGMIIFNCYENGEYLVKYYYPHFNISVESEIFIPKNLKNSIYEYRIPPISSLTFGVRFVVQEKGQNNAVDIHGFFVQYGGKKVNPHGWFASTDKKDKVAYLKVYNPADPGGLFARVMTGEKYKIKINNKGKSPYQLIPGRDSFIAGKKGEQIDIPVTPRVSKSTDNMSTEGNVEN